MKNKSLLVFLFLIIISCKDAPNVFGYDTRMTIINQTASTIFFDIYYSYPDTTIGKHNPFYSPEEYMVGPGLKKRFAIQGSWEQLFLRYKIQKIMICIFDEKIIKTNDWYEIRKHNLVLKKYYFTLKELEDNDWKIIHK
jgi:hypothetical protein